MGLQLKKDTLYVDTLFYSILNLYRRLIWFKYIGSPKTWLLDISPSLIIAWKNYMCDCLIIKFSLIV